MVAPNWRMKKYDFVGWLKKKIHEIYEYILGIRWKIIFITFDLFDQIYVIIMVI